MLPFLLTGALTAGFALIIEVVASSLPLVLTAAPDNTETTLSLVLILTLASIEEVCKFFVLKQMLIREQPQDFLVPALMFGIGFGITEIALARIQFDHIPLPSLVGIGSIHILTTLLYGKTLERFHSRASFAIVLLGGVIIHTFYNAILAR